jgi:hypothetical protein
MIKIKELREAAGHQIEVNWDMGRDFMHVDDWADAGVYVDSEDSGSITISGTDKNLLKWLVNDYGMDKKEAQSEIKKGKRVKI